MKDKARKTKELNGTMIPIELLSAFEIYKREVRNKTKKYVKILFDSWNGIDYYDGEFIKCNLELSSKSKDYRSIDHKTSIIYGFLNNIPAEKIYKIENLCITKRWLNSQKHDKCEVEFKQLLAS